MNSHAIKELYTSINDMCWMKCNYLKKQKIIRGGMFLDNRFFDTYYLKRIHTEHVTVLDGFLPNISVFHSTMFPRLEVNIPCILGIDLVRVGDVHTLAILDTTMIDTHLPESYIDGFDEIHSKYWSDEPSVTREFPEWATDFFSDRTVYLGSDMNVSKFYQYACDIADFHISYIPKGNVPCSTQERKLENIDRYCTTQRQNMKTESILSKALGDMMAKEYMKTIMFNERIYK